MGRPTMYEGHGVFRKKSCIPGIDSTFYLLEKGKLKSQWEYSNHQRMMRGVIPTYVTLPSGTEKFLICPADQDYTDQEYYDRDLRNKVSEKNLKIDENSLNCPY